MVALAGGARAVPTLGLSVGGGGSAGIVAVGATIEVDVFASGIPTGSDGNGLFGFGFSIQFSSAGLDASATELGPLWVLSGFDDSRNDPGDVGLTADRFFQESGPFGDDILLGSIVFEGLLPGLYTLGITHYTGVGDNVLFDGTILDAGSGFFTEGSIQVVPEPGTLELLMLGTLALQALRRSRATR